METKKRQTSIEVYNKIKSGNYLSKCRFEIYECLFHNQPMTSGEVFSLISKNKKSNSPLSQSRARFTELRDMGAIMEVGVKKCSITNNTVILWDVTNKIPSNFKRPQTKKQKINNVIQKLNLIQNENLFLKEKIETIIEEIKKI